MYVITRVVLTKYNGDQMKRSMIGRRDQIKRGRTEETVAPSTSGYNLRPRGGREVESRSAMEMKIQQGGPVQSRKSRGWNDSPYIDKRTRSDSRNARQRGDRQQEDQERKGASTSRSTSLEVLVGDANYKS
ncbi:uncharacterized protein TNCV_694161 [Trichonephila clavipes]|nr:uncharacterized protein TNCV_694161 [Trichonephila clavipes]